jgi:hypothetical protein
MPQTPTPSEPWWHVLSQLSVPESRALRTVCHKWRACIDHLVAAKTRPAFEAYASHSLTLSMMRMGCGYAAWLRWATTERRSRQLMVVDLDRCIAFHQALL